MADVVEGECDVTTTAAVPLDLREPFDLPPGCCDGVDKVDVDGVGVEVFEEIEFNVVMSWLASSSAALAFAAVTLVGNRLAPDASL